MKFIGINGIYNNGQGNIDLALSELSDRGHEVVDIRLPIRTAFTSRFYTEEDALKVLSQSKPQPEDIVISHSRGGVVAAELMQQGFFKKGLFAHPAVSKNFKFNRPEDVHCFYSEGDWVVKLGSFLLFHRFGKAGACGFTDPLTTNVKITGGHSAAFGNYLHRFVDHAEFLI